MMKFIKDGIDSIKETKRYAREKNVINWMNEVIVSILIIFFIMQISVLNGMLLTWEQVPDYKMPNEFYNTIHILPIFLTFLFTLKYGKFIIKLMILKTFYLQKGVMKLINKLDMYFWKKTGKDSIVASFISKHPKMTQMIFLLPLILVFIFL